MDLLGQVAQLLGAAVNGVLQVVTDFINLIISIVPNPDPLPGIIEELPEQTLVDMGFTWYWIDAFIGVDFASGVLGAWALLMIASAVFAVIYWVIKSVKP